MAFGDKVQDKLTSFSTTQTATFDSTATSGNILWFITGTQSFSATVSTPPSGWTAVQDTTGTALSCATFYKVSDGSETSVSCVWSTGFGFGYFCEIEFGQTLETPISSNEDTSNLSGTTTSQSTSAVTPTYSTNVWVGSIWADQGANVDGGGAWTGSPTVFRAFSSGDSGAAPAVAVLVNVTGSTSSTYSTTDTGDEMYGVSAVFEYNGGGGGSILPLLNAYYS